MGLLDGGIAEVFAGAFGALYLDGLLYRPAAFNDDGMGGGSDPGFAAGEAVKVQIDAATQAMRASEGFVETDQRILVLAHGVSTIDTDCELAAGGTRWMVATVATDPAGSYYELRGRRKTDA
jgi:hypothetical protein